MFIAWPPRCSNEGWDHIFSTIKGIGERIGWTNSLKDLVRPAGLEPAAYGFEGERT